jgi:D-alanine-D-alanine ligase
MRVLVLHSDVAPEAPADEQDTLIAAEAVATALQEHGHQTRCAAFIPEPAALHALLRDTRCDCVFNLVESVFGQGELAALAPAMLAKEGVPYTGCSAASIALTCDKPRTKRLFRAAGLPTPDWAEPPHWSGLIEGRRYIVKSAVEDASLGLDDAAVVSGCDAVRERAAFCASRHGGSWFAEAYLEGREFNLALLEEQGAPRVLPMPEMRFEGWAADRPRLVSYAAKWNEASEDSAKTVRAFGIETEEPALAQALAALATRTWDLLGLRGFARVDFRLDQDGAPMILEINPNPGIAPDAGFAAAAAAAGLTYADAVERILFAAV